MVTATGPPWGTAFDGKPVGGVFASWILLTLVVQHTRSAHTRHSRRLENPWAWHCMALHGTTWHSVACAWWLRGNSPQGSLALYDILICSADRSPALHERTESKRAVDADVDVV